MESKHKNALIGALLAVVFVMAVGYAAFAQLLTINGTATIDSSWDVHFDDPTDSIACHAGIGTTGVDTCGSDTTGNTNPYGAIAYDNTSEKPTVANLTAHLLQPGDTVTFTLKPTNYGSLAAKVVGDVVIQAGTGETAGTGAGELNIATGGQSATKGNIKWEIVNFTPKSSITGANGAAVADANQDTIVVKATFLSNENAAVATQTASIKIEINYQQA